MAEQDNNSTQNNEYGGKGAYEEGAYDDIASLIEGGEYSGQQQKEEENAFAEGKSKGVTSVASAPSKFFISMAGLIAFVLFMVFIVFGEDEPPEKPMVKDVPVVIAKPAPPPPPPAPRRTAPPPPPPPRVVAPPPPPVEVPVPPPPAPPVFVEDEEAIAARRERLQSPMIVVSNDSIRSPGMEEVKESNGRNEVIAQTDDPNGLFVSRLAASGEVARAKATHIGKLSSTIAQGKVIHAALETAIDTQLPGVIRAVVSRDVFGEAGKEKLIPKGSRLIGTYNTSLFRGQTRVFAVWTRVIRPDGVDIMINSPASDSLGRSGIAGYVDKRYDEIMTGALLTSVIMIGVAMAADEIAGEENRTTQTTNTNGSVTTSTTPVGQAVTQSVGRVGSTASRIINDMIDTREKIIVDQGTKITILVNRDLVFPEKKFGNEAVFR